MLYRIGHYQEVHWHDVLHVDLEHSIYSSYDAVGIVFQVLVVLRKGIQKHSQFVVVHSFDDEFLVVGKEEKAARFALAFTGFENLIPVQLC